MKKLPLFALVTALTCVGLSAAVQYEPPTPVKPDEAVLKTINARADQLSDKIMQLRRVGVHDPNLADVEIFHKAAVWTLRYGEFFNKDSADWTLAVLDRGLLRSSQQARGEAPWLLSPAGQHVARAYRSGIDGPLQP